MAKIQIKNSFITSSGQITISSSFVRFQDRVQAKNVTGSLRGTASYASKTLTASYALNASGGGGGSVQTGSIAKQTILYNFKPSDQATITGLNLTNNKWGVSIVEEWDEKLIPGDPYYTSTSLLMHFSGSNGSTTFRDNSQNNFTITSNNGAAISTAQSKFGTGSGYFDGTDDYINVPDNSAFDFGSGDFTIEYWEYRTSAGWDKTALARNSAFYTPYMMGYATSVGNLEFYSGNGSSWVLIGLNMGSIVLNSWTHYAVTRQGNTFRTFKNGTQIASTTSAITMPAGSAAVQIGKWANSPFQGYLDELRITKGYARYTGSFTPQTSEFNNTQNLTQLATKYIGSVGGLNDTNVDYGIQKLTNSSLKVRKMSTPGTPVSGSPALSASIDRVYVNVLDYTNVSVTSSYATNALTSSYVNGAINAGKVYGMTLLFS